MSDFRVEIGSRSKIQLSRSICKDYLQNNYFVLIFCTIGFEKYVSVKYLTYEDFFVNKGNVRKSRSRPEVFAIFRTMTYKS